MVSALFSSRHESGGGPQRSSPTLFLKTMGTKKTTTTKTDAPSKRAAKPTATVKLAASGKRPVAKKPAAPRKRAAAKAPKAPAFTQEDIATRAYFVSERRRAAGLPGDEHGDWLEAERQLLAENS